MEGVMWRRDILIALALILALPVSVSAQTANPPVAPAATQQSSSASAGLLKPEELEGLVAPIALFPDPLLSNILMSSTDPLEIVQAERWLNQNKTPPGRCAEIGRRAARLG
jgi:hypothetical protein